MIKRITLCMTLVFLLIICGCLTADIHNLRIENERIKQHLYGIEQELEQKEDKETHESDMVVYTELCKAVVAGVSGEW